jgi:hypothetical protein
MYSVHDLLAEGFPHSDIRGSTIARISPRLFAACHVLHRLLAPRHPPNALISLENYPNTARAQDQTAQGVPSPARLDRMLDRRRHYFALVNLHTHRTNHRPTAPPSPGLPAGGQLVRQILFTISKNMPSQAQRPRQESHAREVRNFANSKARHAMEASGFEPLTPCLQSRCSTS